jgi:hypothetical protein
MDTDTTQRLGARGDAKRCHFAERRLMIGRNSDFKRRDATHFPFDDPVLSVG